MIITKKDSPETVTIDGVEYERLPLEFEAIDYTYKQIARTEKAAIYSVMTGYGKIGVWEVFKIKLQKGQKTTMGGVDVEFKAKEKYPNNEDFGVWAGCFTDQAKAIAAYNNIK